MKKDLIIEKYFHLLHWYGIENVGSWELIFLGLSIKNIIQILWKDRKFKFWNKYDDLEDVFHNSEETEVIKKNMLIMLHQLFPCKSSMNIKRHINLPNCYAVHL